MPHHSSPRSALEATISSQQSSPGEPVQTGGRSRPSSQSPPVEAEFPAARGPRSCAIRAHPPPSCLSVPFPPHSRAFLLSAGCSFWLEPSSPAPSSSSLTFLSEACPDHPIHHPAPSPPFPCFICLQNTALPNVRYYLARSV